MGSMKWDLYKDSKNNRENIIGTGRVCKGFSEKLTMNLSPER